MKEESIICMVILYVWDMISNNKKPLEELTIVIDPGAYTHMMTYENLMNHYNKNKNDKKIPFPNFFSQLYFENPENKCILIRGCKDKYENDNGKIKLKTEDKFMGMHNLHGKYKYQEIENIITQQAKVLGIDLNRIKRINIFDISHADKIKKRCYVGFIDEKVDALKALNKLCPNCEHTKIGSTACWGGRKDGDDRDLIEEVKKSIEGNKDWHKNNIVEIDITPDDNADTKIKIGKDNKPHVSYCLHEYTYEKDNKPLPPTFTRHIHLLAKGKNNIYVPQEHTFQNNQHRVTEGEGEGGGFTELSKQYIKQAMQLKDNRTGNEQRFQNNQNRFIDGKGLSKRYIKEKLKLRNGQTDNGHRFQNNQHRVIGEKKLSTQYIFQKKKPKLKNIQTGNYNRYQLNYARQKEDGCECVIY